MASACNRFVSRSALSSLKSAIKSKARSPCLNGSTSAPKVSSHSSKPSSSTGVPLRRFSSITNRSPSELGCAQSLLPLHSALAVSRLTSCLSLNSSSCRALSQAHEFPNALDQLLDLPLMIHNIILKARTISSQVKKVVADPYK